MANSYIPRLKALSEREGDGIRITHCGMGGIQLYDLVYIVDDLLDQQASDWVVFEVATSSARNLYYKDAAADRHSVRLIVDHVRALIAACRRRGRQVAFVDLPRRDIFVEQDLLESVIARVCSHENVPHMSLSFDSYVTDYPLAIIMNDGVHPNTAGAEYYASAIHRFIKARLQTQAELTSYAPRRFSSMKAPPLMPGAATTSFARHGFRELHAPLRGGEPVTLDLGQTVRLKGLSVLTGPRASMLNIEAGGQSVDFDCYDEFCYYFRLKMLSTLDIVTSRLTLTLGADLPDIKLFKGEPDLSSREIGLFNVLYEPV
jgi:hypothetical protein